MVKFNFSFYLAFSCRKIFSCIKLKFKLFLHQKVSTKIYIIEKYTAIKIVFTNIMVNLCTKKRQTLYFPINKLKRFLQKYDVTWGVMVTKYIGRESHVH